MYQPLVSIIIPTYNRAHLISDTLDSIMNQNYKNWECIIVDDWSTDETEEVLKKIMAIDSRFYYYKRPSNKPKGANACRNYGFEMSKGAFVNWFDSDDIMSVNKVNLSVESLLDNEADLLICSNNKTEISFDSKLINNHVVYKSDFYREYILNRISILTGDVIFKRQIVENYLFDEKLHKAQEYEFFSRVFVSDLKIVFTDSVLWYHRESPDSISALAGKMNLEQLNSLVYLSSKLQERFYLDNDIVNEAKRQGKKLYISIVKKNKVCFFLKNYKFFASCFTITYHQLFFWFIYNLFTKRGFDLIKKKSKLNKKSLK